MTDSRFRLLVTGFLLGTYLICSSFAAREETISFFYGIGLFLIFVIEWTRSFMRNPTTSNVDSDSNGISDISGQHLVGED